MFTSIAELGLDRELVGAMGDAAGQRNVLVHGYLEVDPAEVWAALARLAFAAWASERAKGEDGVRPR